MGTPDMDTTTEGAVDKGGAEALVSVKIHTSVAGPDFKWRPGQTVELPASVAAKWADGVRASYVDQPAGVLETEQLLDQLQAEALKERWQATDAEPTPPVPHTEQPAAKQGAAITDPAEDTAPQQPGPTLEQAEAQQGQAAAGQAGDSAPQQPEPTSEQTGTQQGEAGGTEPPAAPPPANPVKTAAKKAAPAKKPN